MVTIVTNIIDIVVVFCFYCAVGNSALTDCDGVVIYFVLCWLLSINVLVDYV